MQHLRLLALGVLLAALLTAYLDGVRYLLGAPFSLVGGLRRWGWLLALLAVARWGRGWSAQGARWYFPPHFWVLLAAWLASLTWYLLTLSTSSAWIMSGMFYTVVLVSASGVSTSTESCPRLPRLLCRGVGWGTLAVLGGLLPVALQQVESRFSEEEFFAVLDVVALTLFTALLLIGYRWLDPHARRAATAVETFSRGIHLNARLVLVLWAAILLLWAGGVAYAYQRSFYSTQAPTFAGVTANSPFLCGLLPSTDRENGAADGETVFDGLLSLVKGHPNKTSLEFGMLALATGERQWAEAFREAILEEADAGQFTNPAKSVKFIQHQAAFRVYYLGRVRDTFPDLFSDHDWSFILEWLRAINRRSLTVEWVDWMYGLAFSKWPEGPYENQENGAGLLAVLETLEGDELYLDTSDLSRRNQGYLDRNRRGWYQRFRNTDDAYIYQPEWINNALFQSLYWGDYKGETSLTTRNQWLSFEWLLLQALPDGAALQYNHPARSPLAMIAYLGADLLRDPRYLWLSSRSLEAVEAAGRHLSAQPGVEAEVELSGTAPSEGSCLLFGDSGLPNQQGPLAPDKVVFRSGWLADSAYLLLNLRFTGWHRYKSTNSVVLIYQEGPLIAESSIDKPLPWLPVGRSQFRDKRIPRENLNGLLIPRTGMSRVLYELTGAGGTLWAQDPPHYARVERFETPGPLDVSRTLLENWHDWNHTRTIYFIRRGPIVVVDMAENSRGKGEAAITWHLVGQGQRDDNGLWLRKGTSPALLALPQAAWETTHMTRLSRPKGIGLAPDWELMYHSPDPGRLSLSTVFLLGDWTDANYETITLRNELRGGSLGQHVRVAGSSGEVELLHNESSVRLERGTLSTDGQSLLVLDLRGVEGKQICYVGGQEHRIRLQEFPAHVTDTAGHPLMRGSAWDWMNATLILYGNAESSQCVRVIPI